MSKRRTYPYGERIVEKYLQNRFGWRNGKDYIHPYISNHKSWLKGGHLDFLLLHHLHKAIEVDGAEHKGCVSWYGQVNLYQQKINLVNQISRDFTKDKLCKKHKLDLIRIDTDFKRKSTIRRHVKATLDQRLGNLNLTFSATPKHFSFHNRDTSVNQRKVIHCSRNIYFYQELSSLNVVDINILITILYFMYKSKVLNASFDYQFLARKSNYFQLKSDNKFTKQMNHLFKHIKHQHFINSLFYKFYTKNNQVIVKLNSKCVVKLQYFIKYLDKWNFYYLVHLNQSKYAKIIFLLLINHKEENKLSISEIDLRKLLDVNHQYPRFANFNNRVIEPIQAFLSPILPRFYMISFGRKARNHFIEIGYSKFKKIKLNYRNMKNNVLFNPHLSRKIKNKAINKIKKFHKKYKVKVKHKINMLMNNLTYSGIIYVIDHYKQPNCPIHLTEYEIRKLKKKLRTIN